MELKSVVQELPAGHQLSHAATAGLPQAQTALVGLHCQPALAGALLQVTGPELTVGAGALGLSVKRFAPGQKGTIQLSHVRGVRQKVYPSAKVAVAALNEVV